MRSTSVTVKPISLILNIGNRSLRTSFLLKLPITHKIHLYMEQIKSRYIKDKKIF